MSGGGGREGEGSSELGSLQGTSGTKTQNSKYLERDVRLGKEHQLRPRSHGWNASDDGTPKTPKDLNPKPDAGIAQRAPICGALNHNAPKPQVGNVVQDPRLCGLLCSS